MLRVYQRYNYIHVIVTNDNQVIYNLTYLLLYPSKQWVISSTGSAVRISIVVMCRLKELWREKTTELRQSVFNLIRV